jgi:hypothetical protein
MKIERDSVSEIYLEGSRAQPEPHFRVCEGLTVASGEFDRVPMHEGANKDAARHTKEQRAIVHLPSGRLGRKGQVNAVAVNAALSRNAVGEQLHHFLRFSDRGRPFVTEYEEVSFHLT